MITGYIFRSLCSGIKFISFRQGLNIGLGLDTVNTYHPIQDVKNLRIDIPEKKVILFLGDPRPRKGLADFLIAAEKAFESENNLILWIAGKNNLTIQTNVPHKLIVCPTDEELACLYSACDVFVSSSWYEGFGLPPLEAMACGAAVVTTDSRGIHEYAVDGYNCLIVPPKNPIALAEAILSLLSNPELSAELRENGPGTAARFDWEIATDRFEAALISPDV